MASQNVGPRILFLALEKPVWRIARHISYASSLGLEEGLSACGARFTTITTPWFYRAQHFLRGQKFDQVWIEISREEKMDTAFLQWVETMAPVRVGFFVESLKSNAAEQAGWSELAFRESKVEARLPYVTHVVAVDEADADDMRRYRHLPALWWPQAVPRRYFAEPITTPPNRYGVFTGGIYGERAKWLASPELQGLLVHQPSPEAGTPYPLFFALLHAAFRYRWDQRLPLPAASLALYMAELRWLRRRCFARWLDGMQTGCAVVNLPSLVKAYAGRIYEAMAVGRPVVSQRIPDRPLTAALFEENKEILFYDRDKPEELAEHLRRLIADESYARKLAETAQRKVREFHTIEKRCEQILRWAENGDEPIYQ